MMFEVLLLVNVHVNDKHEYQCNRQLSLHVTKPDQEQEPSLVLFLE